MHILFPLYRSQGPQLFSSAFIFYFVLFPLWIFLWGVLLEMSVMSPHLSLAVPSVPENRSQAFFLSVTVFVISHLSSWCFSRVCISRLTWATGLAYCSFDHRRPSISVPALLKFLPGNFKFNFISGCGECASCVSSVFFLPFSISFHFGPTLDTMYSTLGTEWHWFLVCECRFT